MENHEEDDLDELRSTVYTFPQSVQDVIEQVRHVVNLLSNCYLMPACDNHDYFFYQHLQTFVYIEFFATSRKLCLFIYKYKMFMFNKIFFFYIYAICYS